MKCWMGVDIDSLTIPGCLQFGCGRELGGTIGTLCFAIVTTRIKLAVGRSSSQFILFVNRCKPYHYPCPFLSPSPSINFVAHYQHARQRLHRRPRAKGFHCLAHHSSHHRRSHLGSFLLPRFLNERLWLRLHLRSKHPTPTCASHLTSIARSDRDLHRHSNRHLRRLLVHRQ